MSLEQLLRGRRVSDRRCPVCRERLEPAEAMAHCPIGHADIHADCLELTARCPALGCESILRRAADARESARLQGIRSCISDIHEQNIPSLLDFRARAERWDRLCAAWQLLSPILAVAIWSTVAWAIVVRCAPLA